MTFILYMLIVIAIKISLTSFKNKQKG